MQAEACLWFFRIFVEKNNFFLFFKFCPTVRWLNGHLRVLSALKASVQGFFWCRNNFNSDSIEDFDSIMSNR